VTHEFPYACPPVLVVLLVVTDFAELECFELW
jgi:hypothetical protein